MKLDWEISHRVQGNFHGRDQSQNKDCRGSVYFRPFHSSFRRSASRNFRYQCDLLIHPRAFRVNPRWLRVMLV